MPHALISPLQPSMLRICETCDEARLAKEFRTVAGMSLCEGCAHVAHMTLVFPRQVSRASASFDLLEKATRLAAEGPDWTPEEASKYIQSLISINSREDRHPLVEPAPEPPYDPTSEGPTGYEKRLREALKERVCGCGPNPKAVLCDGEWVCPGCDLWGMSLTDVEALTQAQATKLLGRYTVQVGHDDFHFEGEGCCGRQWLPDEDEDEDVVVLTTLELYEQNNPTKRRVPGDYYGGAGPIDLFLGVWDWLKSLLGKSRAPRQ